MDQQVHKCNKEDKIDEMEKKITLLDRFRRRRSHSQY